MVVYVDFILLNGLLIKSTQNLNNLYWSNGHASDFFEKPDRLTKVKVNWGAPTWSSHRDTHGPGSSGRALFLIFLTL